MTTSPMAHGLAAALLLAAGLARAADAAQVPITTASPEARRSYLEGRDAGEKLRIEDARRRFVEALGADPDFATAHLALANTATSAQGFFDELKRAVALADRASPGERHVILAQDAGVRGDLETQRRHLDALLQAFPGDVRVQVLVGNYHFGRQEYAEAVAHYRRATAIDPSFSQTWNQLGYAHRSLGQLGESEKAFRRYVELLPGEPNPYDSLAELLMKMGRHQESIETYRKALSVDPHFVASYVGIGNDLVLMGKPAEGRDTFGTLLAEVARNDGERRQALFWTAASWVHEGKTEDAVATCRRSYAIAEQGKDAANMSADLNQIGLILLHAGKLEAAAAEFAKAVGVLEGADVPAAVKENVKRNHLYFEARTAIGAGDLATARARADAYRGQVQVKKIPFEVRRVHELAGLIALEGKAGAEAVKELLQASQQDPEVLYHLALAYDAQGDRKKARAMFEKVAAFNELNFNLAFVREKARRVVARS